MPLPVIVSDRTPGQESSRSVASLAFRSEHLEYDVTFRHVGPSNEHYMVVESPAKEASATREPRWIEFVLDERRFRFERWTRLQQGAKRVAGEFTCAGTMYMKCERPKGSIERYVWSYRLPQEAVLAFAAMKSGRAVLAAQDVAISLDFSDEVHLVRDYFRATTTGSAYE